jgi:ABC-type Mn2+/Zn2+ transport system ATPase subunit
VSGSARRSIGDSPTFPGPHSADVLAEAHDLAVAYGPHVAIEHVSFQVRSGERVGLIGPNGGGKTTLFRAMLGDLRPSAGSLEVRVRCGSVPQTQRSRLDYPVTALDVTLMGLLSRLPWWRRPSRADRRGAVLALGEVGMADRADELFGELSGGQQQRVLIARALVQDARLLLLDEPFTGVDQTNVEIMLALLERLASEGRGLIIATHDVDQARDWDRILCLNHSQVAFGPPEQTLSQKVLSQTYPGTVVVLSHQGHESRHEEEPSP